MFFNFLHASNAFYDFGFFWDSESPEFSLARNLLWDLLSRDSTFSSSFLVCFKTWFPAILLSLTIFLVFLPLEDLGFLDFAAPDFLLVSNLLYNKAYCDFEVPDFLISSNLLDGMVRSNFVVPDLLL